MEDKRDKFLDRMEDYVVNAIRNRAKHTFSSKENILVRLASEQTFEFFLKNDLINVDKLQKEAGD